MKTKLSTVYLDNSGKEHLTEEDARRENKRIVRRKLEDLFTFNDPYLRPFDMGQSATLDLVIDMWPYVKKIMDEN